MQLMILRMWIQERSLIGQTHSGLMIFPFYIAVFLLFLTMSCIEKIRVKNCEFNFCLLSVMTALSFFHIVLLLFKTQSTFNRMMCMFTKNIKQPYYQNHDPIIRKRRPRLCQHRWRINRWNWLINIFGPQDYSKWKNTNSRFTEKRWNPLYEALGKFKSITLKLT